MKLSAKFSAPLLLSALALGACSDGTGPDGNSGARVLLSRGAASASPLPAAVAALQSATGGPLQLSSVQTIELTITEVEAHRRGTDSTDDSGWTRIPLTGSLTTFNLLGLPSDTTTGLLLARGDLAAGQYGDLRLRVGEAFITLTEGVRVGQSTLAAGQRIALEIPSGVIKTGASFVVPEDSAATVSVIFDADASVRNVTATSSGQVVMNPVLRARSADDD